MADFDKAVKKTIDFEGGYTDGKGDYGGETKYGISRRQYPGLDIKNLTIESARSIYCRDYWDPLRLDEVESQAVAEEMFDTSVNLDWLRSALWLQECLNLLADADLKVDGLIGPATLKALHDYLKAKPWNESVLVKALDGLQFAHYWLEGKTDPKQRKHLAGWINQRVGNALAGVRGGAQEGSIA